VDSIIITKNYENYSIKPDFTLPRVIFIDFIDNGHGISVENPEDIFEPTFTTKPSKFGTGLGLFIARNLINQLGGSINVLNKRNEYNGATFRIILPIK
jgi:two-component system, NtrC family, sensor kinase